MMKIELDMPIGLEEQLRNLIITTTNEALEISKQKIAAKEWMNLREGAAYAGVSYGSFIKFRAMGLKVCEIDGIKRVSKRSIDDFLEKNSY